MDLPPLDPLYWALGVTALVAALGFRPWRPQAGKLSIRLTSAVLLPAALMASWYGITGEVLPVPPAEAKDWIPWCALGAVLIGVTEVRAMNALGVGILVGAVMGHGLERVIAYDHGEGAAAIHSLGIGLVSVLAHLATRSAARTGGLSGVGVAGGFIAIFVTAAMIQRGTWGGGGLLLGGACFALGALGTLGLLRKDWRPFDGSVAPVCAVLVAVLAVGHYSAGTPLGASLAVIGLTQLFWLRGKGALGRWGVGVLGLALVAYALWDSWPEPNPYAEYY